MLLTGQVGAMSSAKGVSRERMQAGDLVALDLNPPLLPASKVTQDQWHLLSEVHFSLSKDSVR